MSRVHDATLDPGALRLKLASKALVKALHGTEIAGEAAGMRQQRVSECTLPNTPSFFAIDQVAALEEAAVGSKDWPQVTRAMARAHGFALLPLLDEAAGLGDGEWHAALAAVSREANEAVARVCGTLADGRVTAEEIRDGEIVEEIDDAIAALARLRALADAVLKAGRKER